MARLTTVESFSLQLDDFLELQKSGRPVEVLEEKLLSRLESPVRLLRWAIVQVDADRRKYRCEGAYLKSAS